MGLIKESKSQLPNGNLLICKIHHIGASVESPLPFGFCKIRWWGSCDPRKKGYRHILWNIYKKPAKGKEMV